VFHQILSALLYLKANNLSHRDIKPENILFDEHWNAKLIDFGFSCNNSHNKGFRNTVCGTPSYTPPEIIKKTAYDPELVDVWSLGVTLYAMLSAHLPFDGEDNDARRKNILGFRFRQLPTFSNKVQKLFASIFVDAKYRPRLNDLKTSEFFLSYDFAASECIDFKL
jgi:carbon catabolite-derepressing protein kinase